MSIYKKPQISNEIVRFVGEISTTAGGYKKELNLISWNGWRKLNMI
nr:hypothetical protein [Mycoplasmopsis bovis]